MATGFAFADFGKAPFWPVSLEGCLASLILRVSATRCCPQQVLPLAQHEILTQALETAQSVRRLEIGPQDWPTLSSAKAYWLANRVT